MSAPTDPLVESWRTRRSLADHTRLELAYAVHAGHRPGESAPLTDGEPVPGCGCRRCTGLDDDEEVWDLFKRDPAHGEPLPVEEARQVPLLDVCRRLALGEPVGRYGEPRVLCPLHDDHEPSLRLNLDRGLWFCDPCGEGGDGIQLVMRAQRLDFAQAVKWIAEGGR